MSDMAYKTSASCTPPVHQLTMARSPAGTYHITFANTGIFTNRQPLLDPPHPVPYHIHSNLIPGLNATPVHDRIVSTARG